MSQPIKTCSTSFVKKTLLSFMLVFLVPLHANQVWATNKLSLSSLVENLPASWSIKVSPDKEIYITHREGKLSRYTLEGEHIATYSMGLSDLYYKGQGGLLDIAFHPEYLQSPWIYLSYSFGDDEANGLKVIRVQLGESANKLYGPSIKENIFQQINLRDTAVHYGARLGFLKDNTLLITTGDGFDYREQAQVLSSQIGKILRVTELGDIPKDNPYAMAGNKAQQFVYTVGHRNPQGLVVLANGKVIAHEHGPDGGDELNFIKASQNYGWPVITKGKDYIGSQISPFTEYESMQQPGFDWTPSMAPSGMIYYTHSALPQLQNRLLVTSLKYKQVHSISLENELFTDERILFEENQFRLRDITTTQDGRVFILTDGNTASILEVIMAE